MTEPARDFMAPFLFRCPTTGMTVQDFVAHGDSDADIDLGTHRAITCLACGRVHMLAIRRLANGGLTALDPDQGD
ncbi:MAG: hypothetical protein KIT85_16740 [Pseudolabrys sp.]|nr:hypothetical protein [Pseudolabrys sp.]MCW5686045.1 hypothetical protein [Pseudolabrys sp.]